jgi:hypothetical protein
MAENMSLADQAVQALAMVKAMDANMTNDRPERHQVRQLKRLAEAAIAAGLRQAIDFAWMAQELSAMVKDVEQATETRLQGMQPVEKV